MELITQKFKDVFPDYPTWTTLIEEPILEYVDSDNILADIYLKTYLNVWFLTMQGIYNNRILRYSQEDTIQKIISMGVATLPALIFKSSHLQKSFQELLQDPKNWWSGRSDTTDYTSDRQNNLNETPSSYTSNVINFDPVNDKIAYKEFNSEDLQTTNQRDYNDFNYLRGARQLHTSGLNVPINDYANMFNYLFTQYISYRLEFNYG